MMLDNLSENSALVQLLLANKKHRVPKKHPIVIDSQSMIVCYIQKGYVKRYMITNEGNESVQAIFGPGEVFPLTPVFKELLGQTIYIGEEIFYYATVTETVFYSVNKETLQHAVEDNPLIYKDLFHVAGIRLESNINKLENASLRSAQSRVAHILAHYAEKFGKKTDTGIVIQLELTHGLIASELNLARETVSNTMSKLADKNIISHNTDSKLYKVKDYPALRRLVR